MRLWWRGVWRVVSSPHASTDCPTRNVRFSQQAARPFEGAPAAPPAYAVVSHVVPVQKSLGPHIHSSKLNARVNSESGTLRVRISINRTVLLSIEILTRRPSTGSPPTQDRYSINRNPHSERYPCHGAEPAPPCGHLEEYDAPCGLPKSLRRRVVCGHEHESAQDLQSECIK